MDIKDKKIIVTAGCSGLGMEFTLFLLQKGAIVIPTTRNKDTVLNFQEQVPSIYRKRCMPEILNYDTEEEINQFIDSVESRHSQIYALINCAAFRGKTDEMLKSPLEDWKNHYNVNVFATTYLSIQVAERLIRKDGSIINISSFYSTNIPDNRVYDDHTIPTSLIYASSKAALNYVTQYLGVEYAKKNIRVNAILPGGIKNPSRQSEYFVKQYSYRTPMARMARINEFNDAVLFFLSPDNTFCTGQLISIDGGWGLY